MANNFATKFHIDNHYRHYSMVIYGGESVYVNVALKLLEIKF